MGLGAWETALGVGGTWVRGGTVTLGRTTSCHTAPPPSQSHPAGLAPRGVHVVDGLACQRQTSGQGLWLRDSFFQMCGDDGTWWGSAPTGPRLSRLPGLLAPSLGWGLQTQTLAPRKLVTGQKRPEGSRMWGGMHILPGADHVPSPLRQAKAAKGGLGLRNHGRRPSGGACSWPDKSCQRACVMLGPSFLLRVECVPS